MERDEETRRRGYSSNSYINSLEQALIPIYEPGRIFQQDNAPIHKSETVREWFEVHGIWVMDWPPHSPDLNPIKNIWRLLKLKIFQLYPKLMDHGQSKLDWTKFRDAIQRAWEALDQEVIDHLIESVTRRIRAVKKAKGWYTKC